MSKLLEHSATLKKTASWVVVDLATGQPVLETFSKSVADKVNTAKYRVVPIGVWLGSLGIR